MGQFYKGKYTLKNRDKYIGDANNIVYRSSWERAALKWCDTNPNIIQFNSEEFVIPYVCKTDNKVHRYFLDLWFKTRMGKTYIVEIKPKTQLSPSRARKNSPRYITESLTYIKNQSKWHAASEFAKDNGIIFQIWTEETLKELGIKIITPLKKKKYK